MAFLEHSNNSPEHAPSGRVLVVDDNAKVRRLLCLALEAAGLAVDAACSEAEVWQHLTRTVTPPDVLLLNLDRAEYAGLDLLSRVRADTRLATVPIVFLARYGDDDLRWQAVRAGADWFGVRPLSMLDLQRRVLKLLRTGRPRLRAIAGTSRPHAAAWHLKRVG